MAEAHSAVAFSFTVTHEGVNVNFDREMLRMVWASGVRSWRKRTNRFQNNLKTGVYPAPLYSYYVTTAVLGACHSVGMDFSFGLIDYVRAFHSSPGMIWTVSSCSLASLGLWSSFIISVRYMLRMLLLYQGWMYEQRGPGGKASISTRLWGLAVKILSGSSRPMLYSFQGSLPCLPVPAIKDTTRRYLRSVRPLVDDEKYARMVQMAAEFERGIGNKLQRYLVLKSWWSSNYVSDWWEEYVYLRGRSPLMVNSNFYGIDAILVVSTNIQAARAATVTHNSLLFRRAIERQELEPIMVQKLVPLCSWQYERQFNTTRVPGEETDTLQHYMDSTHIVVIHMGRYFKMPLYRGGLLLEPHEIERQFEMILSDSAPPEAGENHVGSLTADARPTWAKVRTEHFARGKAKASIDAIEKAAFVVVLDDVDYEYDLQNSGKLDHYGRRLLHGSGCDRWYDKSFNIIVGKNGRIGFNAEHSWADAAVMSHLWEWTLAEELDTGYDPEGHCKGYPCANEPPKPVKLQWDFGSDCLLCIEESYQRAQELLKDVDIRIYTHNKYGKGFMKKCRVSPDAYVQMGLQLAYYRDAGRFNLSYEASMTRLFREGRTETVRPCTIESCEFVRSMEDQSIPNAEKVSLLKKACAVHQRSYQDAMVGKGIDRHLFCLYVVSKYLEVDSPFLKEVLSEPWRLSTSQTPHGQTAKLDFRKHPNCISAGGGFGPVAHDGYGVSYIIAGEDLMFFHVSSKNSSPETKSSRFVKNLERAFTDMHELFTSIAKKQDGVDGIKNHHAT